MKTSILIVAPSLTHAGMESQLVTLLRNVNPDEFQIELALFRDLPCPLRNELPSFVKVTDLQKQGKLDLTFYSRLYSLLRSHPATLINSKPPSAPDVDRSGRSPMHRSASAR